MILHWPFDDLRPVLVFRVSSIRIMHAPSVLSMIRSLPCLGVLVRLGNLLIPQPEIPSPITFQESLLKGLLGKNDLMDFFRGALAYLVFT